jgi:hypothetical protein
LDFAAGLLRETGLLLSLGRDGVVYWMVYATGTYNDKHSDGSFCA